MDDITRHGPTAIRIAVDLLPLGLGLVLLPLMIAAGVAALRKAPPTLSHDLLHRFGIGAVSFRPVVALGLLWLVLFTSFILGVLWLIGARLWIGLAMIGDHAPDDRWHLLILTPLLGVLATVVALPFTLLRTGFAALHGRRDA